MKTVIVKEFGTAGNYIDDDTAALQAALDSGADVVEIPSGFYKISTALKVKTGQTIHAAPDAVIKLADHAGKSGDDFLLTNEKDAKGITIDGGTWDGNCGNNPRGEEFKQGAYGGVTINFTHCSDLTLKNLNMRNTESFSIRVGRINNFHIENITLQNDIIRPNQDGVHVGGYSTNGVIKNIKASVPLTPYDDMVALNADDDVTRHFNQGMECGPIDNITVDNIEALSAYTFVRLLSNQSELSNINISNIKGYCTHFAININNWRFERSSGNIHDVVIENVEVGKIGSENKQALIGICLNTNNLLVKNLRRLDALGDVSTLEVNNESVNLFTLTGISSDQIEQAKAASPTSLVLEDNALSEHISVTTNTDGSFALPQGGFDSFILNLSNTPGSCKCQCNSSCK